MKQDAMMMLKGVFATCASAFPILQKSVSILGGYYRKEEMMRHGSHFLKQCALTRITRKAFAGMQVTYSNKMIAHQPYRF